MILLLLLAMQCGESRAQDDECQLQVQTVVWAQKGLCVFVPCTFKCPKDSSKNTYGSWYHLSGEQYNQREDLVAASYRTSRLSSGAKGRFKLIGNPKDGNCSLLITDVQKRDHGIYYFRMERGYGIHDYLKSKVSLEVIDQMDPDIYILEPLWPKRWGTVICVFNATLNGCLAPSFSWKGSVLSSSQSQVSTHQSSVLKIAPGPQDEGTDLTCSVWFAPKGQIFQKTVRLDVAYAPQNLIIHHISHDKGAGKGSRWLFRGSGHWDEVSPPGSSLLLLSLQLHCPMLGPAPSFHLQAQKGSFLQLLCEASSHPPASLSWVRGDRVLSCSQSEDTKALALLLPSVMKGDAGTYTCHAENALGLEMRVVQLEVQYAPEDLSVTVSIENRTVLQNFQNANTLEVLQGQSLQLRCVADSIPPANLNWVRGSLPLSPVHPTDPGLLLLPHIQQDQEGKFTCEAQNLLGSEQVSVTIQVYSPAQLLGLHCSLEVSALRCSCLARGRPVPALRWWLGPELLPGNYSKSSVQLRSSAQGLWANSSLNFLREFDTGLTLSCEAWNIHGAQNGSVLLPDVKGTLKGAFSNGVLVGTGILGLLCLCVTLILVIILRRRTSLTERRSHGSSILDYINIFPGSGSQAQNQEAESHGPSQPPPSARSLQPRKNPKLKQNPREEHCAMSHAEATPPPQASQDQEDEVQYSHLHFPGRMPRVLQARNNSHEEYVEIRFH